MPSAEEVVVSLTGAREPTLGSGRLICIDGPAGSGKTTLAAAIARLEPAARVIHMDDLYDGWEGLPHLGDQLDDLLLPLTEGRPGSYRRYDWLDEAFAETVSVPPVDLLVLEGVGSGALRHAALITTLVWISVPPQLRLERGLTRDGAAAESHWRRWMLGEAAHHARERTRERADVLVDGTGSTAPALL
ncbi:4-amino-4-deoxy-L-arabinose transferase [Nocardioides sp.]|uniref:4-amino-4-deoxy-L-arabinose transferase n=1 Tax=Nocardioides sp. TaxID=35761 RepID=UPI003D1447F7